MDGVFSPGHVTDGGSFAMDWRNRAAGSPDLAPDTPTLLVIHGLNGHSEEACVLYAMVGVFLSTSSYIGSTLKFCGIRSRIEMWSNVVSRSSHATRRYPTPVGEQQITR